MNDPISEALGAAVERQDLAKIDNQVMEVSTATKSLVEAKKENQTNDYDEARTNIKSLIKDSMTLMPDLVNLTREAYSDKMYKAAAEFVKTLADLNVSLLDLSEVKETASSRKEEKKQPIEDKSKGETNIYIGTTEDMLDRIASKDKEQVAVPKS